MMKSTHGNVLYHQVGEQIAIVTLNRPQVCNAVDEQLAIELDAIVRRIESAPQIRVAILTGAGEKAFCAGADLKAVSATGLEPLFRAEAGFAGFVFAPRRKPWIAAVNGFALAGGLELCLACDLRVASTKASFGLPEVKRGLVALAGGVFRLPRALPRAVALEMIATGDAIDARRAFALGLVNRVVEPGEELEEAIRLAERIVANAPLAVEESLSLARAAQDLSEPQLIALSATAGKRIRQTEDFQEGPRAFAEKRPPSWSGR